MADRGPRSILVGKMAVEAYTERHPFTRCFRGRRVIEGLGIGWSLLTFLPIFHLTETTLPSRPFPTGARGALSLGGAALRKVAVQAGSICRAVSITKGRYPGSDVRVVFPIDPAEFFVRGKTAGNGGSRMKPDGAGRRA